MRKLLFKGIFRRPFTEPPPASSDAAVKELATKLDRAARRRLGRSLAIREVDAGSCNGCELEMQMLNSAVYDLERFGLRFVASPRHAEYATSVDRDSAHEMLAAKVEEGARRQAEEAAAKEREKAEKAASRSTGSRSSGSSRRTSTRSSKGDDGGIVDDVVKSGAFKDFMRTAAREIARGMFGTARRR